MADFRLMFDENEAREILELVNEKMSGIFCQKKRRIHFVFLSHISMSGRGQGRILGLCVSMEGFCEVQVVIGRGWQKTAIHELVHAYNPLAKESRIEEITEDVVRYLKIMAPVRGAIGNA